MSCATTETNQTDGLVNEAKINYVDLSKNEQKELVKQYWSIEKRGEPRYPIEAMKKKLSGCVDLIIGINQHGVVNGYKVRSSFPKGVFDKSAAEALNKWTWKATDENTENTPVLTSIRLDFTMNKNQNDVEYLKHCPKIKAQR